MVSVSAASAWSKAQVEAMQEQHDRVVYEVGVLLRTHPAILL